MTVPPLGLKMLNVLVILVRSSFSSSSRLDFFVFLLSKHSISSSSSSYSIRVLRVLVLIVREGFDVETLLTGFECLLSSASSSSSSSSYLNFDLELVAPALDLLVIVGFLKLSLLNSSSSSTSSTSESSLNLLLKILKHQFKFFLGSF